MYLRYTSPYLHNIKSTFFITIYTFLLKSSISILLNIRIWTFLTKISFTTNPSIFIIYIMFWSSKIKML